MKPVICDPFGRAMEPDMVYSRCYWQIHLDMLRGDKDMNTRYFARPNYCTHAAET